MHLVHICQGGDAHSSLGGGQQEMQESEALEMFFVKRVQCGHTCGEKSQLGSERAVRQLRQPKRRKNSDATEICYMANTRPKLLHYYICYIVMNFN